MAMFDKYTMCGVDEIDGGDGDDGGRNGNVISQNLVRTYM
jgi:hypothetical protein